jgi:hypothetical protein
MDTNSISDIRPTGLALFSNSESFLTDLTEEDESLITGGDRSDSDSGPRRRRRRPARRPRRRVVRRNRRNRSFSRT